VLRSKIEALRDGQNCAIANYCHSERSEESGLSTEQKQILRFALSDKFTGLLVKERLASTRKTGSLFFLRAQFFENFLLLIGR
jgi:hypothetical protein